LKEREGNRPSVAFIEDMRSTQNSISDFILTEIKEIEGVNALVPGQVISISPHLTVIFGNNGAGKSSYVKLLNNVFRSRGDKQILENVFSETITIPKSCSFIFKHEQDEKYLKFPEHIQAEEFTQYLVFDSHCAKVQLEGENSLIFTPSGFEFFNHAISLFDSLRDKLQTEISKKKSINSFVSYFKHDNVIRNFVVNLGANTDLVILQELASFSDLDTIRLVDLNRKKSELLALQTSDKIAELQNIEQYLNIFIQNAKIILDCLSIAQVNAMKVMIDKYSGCYEVAQKSGIESLKAYNIELLGSIKWKKFIVAAREYADELSSQNEQDETANPENHCHFCLRPLQVKENQLIDAYWQFLKSEAETELQKTVQQLDMTILKLQKTPVIIFDDSSIVYVFLKKKDSALANKWKNLMSNVNDNRLNQIQNITNRSNLNSISGFDALTADFDDILEKISFDIEDLKTKNTANEIALLDIDIQYIQDKQLFSDLKDKIIDFVNDYKWAEKAEQSVNKLRTNAITIKQGELFVLHINDRYKAIFSRECVALKAPKVVELNQRNQKGQTLRRLQVAGNNALQILSEGEQRAISLADFLTEAQIDPNNRGVIFDDPVTSLDHERKDSIAKRLAQESLNRQVIIFTHDISFLVIIQGYAGNIQNLKVKTTTIRRTAENVGLIQPDLPWIAQKVKERIGWLKNDLVRLKKLEKEGADEYSLQVKAWYGLLREGWERAVEERLFKGAVERFSISIQTQRLKKVKITDDLLNQIDRGMTEASKWVHDSAAGLNPPIPDSIQAEQDLKLLEDFAKECESA